MVTINTGCIRVESVIKSADGPLVVYQVDLRAKYAEIGGSAGNDTVILGRGDRTLFTETSDEPTLITFPGSIVAAECSRYTLTVVVAYEKLTYTPAAYDP